MTGTKLSHYRIVGELGRGGMGIVYKAEDTKLDRTVALKILPASALTSDDDRARFHREAKSAAALNHQHIAAIHEIDEAVPEGGSSEEPRPFIAMEYIDGQSLEERLKEGPLDLQESVRIITQVAQALEVAHEKDIVHRDIKSANVMLTKKGDAKVLDFGLAKTRHSTMLTRMGSTLGTVAYMSPEQARGVEVDHRTDLWALGVMLYEFVAGRLPFGGDYEQAVTYSIMNEDPEPLTAIRTGVPMGLEWIVSKLLAKKTEERYQSATDLIVDLKTVDLTQVGMSRTTSVSSMPAAGVIPSVSPQNQTKGLHPAILVLILIAAIAGGWLLGNSGGSDSVVSSMKRISQPIPLGGVIAAMDISPDGRLVAFGTDTIEILDLTQGGLRTYDVPEVFVHLAFSPDGQTLLLTTSTGLKSLSIDSGAVIDLGETAEGGPRAEWIDAESIIYEERSSVWTRSLTTGESRGVIPVDTVSGNFDADFPVMLPDGETIMATGQLRGEPDWLGFWDLESGDLKARIDLPALRAQWLESGHLVFVLEGDLVAMPFDVGSLSQTGPLISLDQHVRPEGLAVSAEGTLVHVGTRIGIVNNTRPIKPILMRMTGASISMETSQDLFPSAIYRSAAVSPDGTRAAVVVEGEMGAEDFRPPSDIWILDFRSGTRRAITTGGASDYPAWSVSGDSLYFVRDNGGNSSILVKAASGRGAEETILDTSIPILFDLTTSLDGNWLAFAGGIPTSQDLVSGYVVWDLRAEQQILLGETDRGNFGANGNPRHFEFSPGSKYLAYEDQGGIFVQSVEDLGSPPYMIWENGKTLPKWAPDGSMLYVRDTVSGGDATPVQLDPFFSTIGPAADMTTYWYVMAGDFFDTFPETDLFLAALPDSEAEAIEDEAVEEQAIDLNVIVNLTNELSKED